MAKSSKPLDPHIKRLIRLHQQGTLADLNYFPIWWHNVRWPEPYQSRLKPWVTARGVLPTTRFVGNGFRFIASNGKGSPIDQALLLDELNHFAEWHNDYWNSTQVLPIYVVADPRHVSSPLHRAPSESLELVDRTLGRLRDQIGFRLIYRGPTTQILSRSQV